MKKLKLKLPIKLLTLSIVTVLFAAIAMNQVMPTRAAGSATMYLSPASGSVESGSNITLSVYENSGSEPVNTVKSAVNYDASKFDYVSIDASGSGFEMPTPDSISSGSIVISRGTITPKTGAVFIFRFTLRAKAGSGNSSVTIDKSNSFVVAVAGTTDILTTVQNGSYTLTTPVTPTTPSTPAPTIPSKKTPSTKTPATNNTSTDTVTPKISKEVSVNAGFNTVTLSWETDEPVRGTVEYGPTKDLGLSVSSSELTAKPTLTLDFKNVRPGTSYFYRVKSSDAAGNVLTGDITTFQTQGYKVTVILKDKMGKPIKKTPVQLFSDPKEGKTDKDGKVTFENIAPGVHTLKLSIDGKQFEEFVTVSDNLNSDKQAVEAISNIAAQEFPITLAVTQKSTSLTSVLVMLSVVAIVGLVGGLSWWWRQKQQASALVHHIAPGVTPRDLPNTLPTNNSHTYPSQVIRPERPSQDPKKSDQN